MFTCPRDGARHVRAAGPPPDCHRCGRPMLAKVRPEPGFDKFDHTFTPAEAQLVLDTIPADSYHWPDIERIGNGRVAQYTAVMLAGRWVPETLEHGYDGHPVRWNAAGDVTHGVMRLLACVASGVSFRTAVVAPPGLLQDLLWK